MSVDVDVPLIDHHCHGLVPRNVTRREFEKMISESFVDAPAGTSHFDAPTARRCSISSPSRTRTPTSSAAPHSARPRSTSAS
jgi:hypothetical protein